MIVLALQGQVIAITKARQEKCGKERKSRTKINHKEKSEYKENFKEKFMPDFKMP